MNVIVNGCTGRMGQIVLGLLERGYGGHTLAAGVSPGAAPYTALAQYAGPADVVVDFSHPAATEALLAYCESRALPVVVGTTGQTAAALSRLREAARRIPVFLSANMSLGVALLARLARQTAALFPEADIEIVEIHHNKKLDVPSGTALLLADSLRQVRPDAACVVGRHENGLRGPRDIGIHSLRLGSEIGTHEILVSTGTQTITLRHEVRDRGLFGEGALTAAAFLQGKGPGLYTMDDLTAGKE